MPVKRRIARGRRGSAESLTRDQQLHLMVGWTFFHDGFTDLEAFRTAWELHRQELTTEFVCEFRSRVFIRPFGWWLCEHKQERPVLAPFSRAEVETHVADFGTAETFGFLHTHVRDARGRWFQEPEESYLRRLGLLTNEEIAWLATLKD